MSEQAVTLQREADAHYAAGRFEAALEGFRAAQALNPTSLALPFNAGNALRRMNRHADAVTAYDQALALAPGFALAHFNKATCLLQLGDLAAGFREYEWRKACPGFVDDPRYALERQWMGEPLVGKRLHIYPELFPEDLLQFGRYAIVAARYARRVTLGAPRGMHAILRTMSPDVELTDGEAAAPDYDLCSALMTVPAISGTTLETVPQAPRYLYAEPERVARWRGRIGLDGFKIGLAWGAGASGGPPSFPLAAAVAALGGQPGVRLIGLHGRDGPAAPADLPAGAIEILGDDFERGPDAFVDAAAAMMSCDLVIAPDSAVIHLAGGLGVRAWLANPFAGDWRWLEGREDSPWYPAVRIFRQPSAGDWTSVFAAMARALATTPRLTAYAPF